MIGDQAFDAARGAMTAEGHRFATFDQFAAVSFHTWEPVKGVVTYDGFSSNDTVNSGAGAGAALASGGTGHDVLRLTLFASTTALTLDLSTPVITLANGFFITGVKGVCLQRSRGADTMTATKDAPGALFNTVIGRFGKDTLSAVCDGASLDGGFGLDVLYGVIGNVPFTNLAGQLRYQPCDLSGKTGIAR